MAMVEDVMAMIDDLGEDERKKFMKFIGTTIMGSLALAVMTGAEPKNMEMIITKMLNGTLYPSAYQTFKQLEATKSKE